MRISLDHFIRLGVLAAACVSVTASAQFLDLDPVPEDPPLQESTLLEQHATRLRSEIDILRKHESSDHVIASISAALHAYRRITFELLAQARVHPDAHHCALVGLLLAEETGEIDSTLVLLGEETPRTASSQELDLTETARLLALLDRFSAQAPNLVDSIDVTNTVELDAALLLALNPLLEVLATLESVALSDPWIATEVDAEPPLVRLRMALDQIEDPEIRARTMELIEQIDPLLRFVDLRLQAEIDGTRIANALRLEGALKEARWLGEQRGATVLAPARAHVG